VSRHRAPADPHPRFVLWRWAVWLGLVLGAALLVLWLIETISGALVMVG
jgi:hypothetical protein